MKKLTIKSLNELAKTMPVIEESLQMSYVGGGNGTSANPYTQEEYESMVSSGIWNGGYVENWGYTFPEMAVSSYDPNNLPKTGVDSYDLMYQGGFAIGYKAGLSGSTLDDIGIGAWSALAVISAGSEIGGVNSDMIWYSKGLRDGLTKGRGARGN